MIRFNKIWIWLVKVLVFCADVRLKYLKLCRAQINHVISNIHKLLGLSVLLSHVCLVYKVFYSYLLYSFLCSFWSWSRDIIIYCSLSRIRSNRASRVLMTSEVMVKFCMWFKYRLRSLSNFPGINVCELSAFCQIRLTRGLGQHLVGSSGNSATINDIRVFNVELVGLSAWFTLAQMPHVFCHSMVTNRIWKTHSAYLISLNTFISNCVCYNFALIQNHLPVLFKRFI